MRKLPPLIELRAFEAAARLLSFKAAADELGVTPTAISHQIRQLETYCGQPLYRRRPRPLSLTEAGATLLPAITAGLDGFADAIAAVRAAQARQPLRITTTNAFASRWLVPRLPDWSRRQPNVPLEVIGTDSVLDLEAGDADVAIRYARSPAGQGACTELMRDAYWPVCTQDMLQAKGRIARAADLRGHVLIHAWWAPSDGQAPTWQRWLQAARRRWRDVPDPSEMGHLSFREELHAIEAVKAGQGIGICSDILVERELAAGTLVKALDPRLPGLGYYLVRPSRPAHSGAIDTFAAWLATETRGR